MRNAKKHELTIFKATASETLDFIKATEAIGINQVWHLNNPLQEANTQIIYLELAIDLEDARQKISTLISAAGISLEWRLLPWKI